MSEPTLGDLLDRYFDLGVAEGREGRNHDTRDGDAQETRQKIAGAIARARQDAAREALDEAVAVVADYAGRQSPIAAAVRALHTPSSASGGDQ